jgi:cation diffusion facilitator CzcD-associated flavoprotein CzcO
MQKSVAIIGAGATGLVGARHMKTAGFDVTLFEIGSQVGGMWVYRNDNGRSSAYKTLHINTAKHLTSFEDYEFDDEVPPFPNHRDMAKYLGDYADHHDLRRHIRFETRVTAVRPAANYSDTHPRWEVETEKGRVDTFDIVVAASGHLTKPMESRELREKFGAGYLHSHDYKDPADFAGKRVCVVGVGNSGLDIASDLCTTAEYCYLVGRTTPVIIPKLIFGRPFWDVIRPFYNPLVPGWLRSTVLRFLVWIVHGRMSVLGFGTKPKRTHASSNANIVNHIRYQRVIPKPGIDEVSAGRLRFSDGEEKEFDVVIAATGYEIEINYLDPEIVYNNGHSLDLYMRIVPPEWRGLYFLGFFNSDTALNWISENQAKWIVALETGQAALPSGTEMKDEILQRRARVRREFEGSPRHGIAVEHLPYFKDLRASLEDMRKRARA